MERRGFLKLAAGLFAGIAIEHALPFAGVALEEAIPFGRVWSFPSNIVIAPPKCLLTVDWINHESLRVLMNNLEFTKYTRHDFNQRFTPRKIGATVGLASHHATSRRLPLIS